MSVRPSIRTSVSPSIMHFPWNWLISFFYIFCMKLGVHRGSKVTEPNFSGKLSFSKKWGKRAQKVPKRPKNRVFGLLCKIELLLFARNDLKWSILWLANFLRKPHFWENSRSRDLWQKWPKKGKNWVSGLLWKIESSLFARKGLKLSVLWLANFLSKSHI